VWERQTISLDKCFNLPNPGLRAYFSHVTEGNREVYRPPFWKGLSPASVLNSWEKVFSSSNVKSEYPSLWSYEMEMKAKVGPMSYQLPLKDRMTDVENYYTMVQLHSEPIDAKALSDAGDFFQSANGIVPRSVKRTIEKMRLDTNSGSPEFGRRSRYLEETENMLDPTSMDIDTAYELVAVLGWRGQEGGPSVKDVKQRVVWMMPFSVNVRELQVYQPLIEACQKNRLVPAWISNDAVDEAITNTWKWKSHDTAVICTDFSKFDQHFNYDMQMGARKILERMVAPSSLSKEWFDTIFPLKYNIPLVCSEKIGFTGDHGMGSGSGGTNADETLAHKALQYECANSIGKTLCPYAQDLGDDGYLCTDGDLKVDDVIRTYSRHGQEMNEDKQYVSADDLVFLRRWHSRDYMPNGIMVGVYPTFRALGRLLYQERFYDPEKWNPKMVTLRAWSILENCNQHPSFEEFVDFVIKGDKYRLGLDIPGFIEDIGHLSNEATTLLPDFLGYTKSIQKPIGIQDWRICKYLKSKA